jgi:MFS family permease
MADDPQLDNLSAEETADAVVAAGRSAAGDVEAPTVFSDLNTMAVVAVTLAGIGCFFNLYATQPVLPLFEILFHASKAAVGRTVSAATLGVAISAPFCGMLAERIGRRRVIVWSIFLLAVPTIGAATANGLHQLVVWRFFQGLVMPGIFGVTIAYITEEWPRRQVAHVMSIYVSGTVLGGFLGRFLTGVAATHALVPFVAPSWRLGFVLIGLLDLIFGLVLWRWLPLDTPLPPSAATGAFGFLRHLRNPQLVATYAVGFSVLFTLVATFTYVTFYMAAPPFRLTPAELSALFMVYLVGLIITPLGGVWISRVGSRTAVVGAVAGGIAGVLLTLVPHLWAVLVGLTLCSSGVFVCQSAASSYIQREARSGGRASAAGLYVMFYYLGGSVAGVVPGVLWRYGQWKACVALIVVVQLISMTIAASAWKGREV